MDLHRAFLPLTAASLALLFASTAAAQQSAPPHGGINYFNDCLACHNPATGETNGLLSCAWCHGESPLFPFYGATTVRTHSSSATGTSAFEYSLECAACHNPHTHEQNIAFGTTYGKYVRELIDESITATDFTAGPPTVYTTNVFNFIEFTNAFQFIDGDTDYTEDVCSTCHTRTNHHQNDGTAPGGQSHFDGARCVTCHSHATGFAPSGTAAAVPPPHDQFDCAVCHDVDSAGNLLNAVPNAAIPNAKCDTCHAAGTPPAAGGGSDVKVSSHYSDTYIDPTTGVLAALNCVECHNPMSEQVNFRGNTNLAFVRTEVRGSPVVFEAPTGPYSFAYDLLDRPADMLAENYVCNTCHTQTNHHQSGGFAPGGQAHNDGLDCTSCHSHEGGFQAAAAGPHPEAQTDCSNCHLDPATGEPDFVGLHDNECALCHESGFDPATFTFLGPSGTWGGECSQCHNPGVLQTGNQETPTKGHRCVACHGEQRSTGGVQDFHERHTESANCVVCHGFIPSTGVAIGSGNRENCQLCHGNSMNGVLSQEFHRDMVPEGTSCIECHSDGRPPVDVFPGPPVGNSEHVCQVCHTGRTPDEFHDDPEDLHKEHSEERLDCGACHLDAHLQDDRAPMPPLDDPRRELVDRTGWNECYFCHEGGKNSSVRQTHNRHVGNQWQWCHNCHEGSDVRPQGLLPPVTQPTESCQLCHSNRSYDDDFPFDIHRRHADRIKCYSCHQTDPSLFAWPAGWLDPGN